TRYNIPSRFLREIPEKLLKWLQRAQSPLPGNHVASGSIPFGNGPRVKEVGAADRVTPWRVGQNVIHARFGAGVIVSCEGRGADARVEVRFGRAGTKWLLLEYAKLTPA